MVRFQAVELGVFCCNGELRNDSSKLVNMANFLLNGEIVMFEDALLRVALIGIFDAKSVDPSHLFGCGWSSWWSP